MCVCVCVCVCDCVLTPADDADLCAMVWSSQQQTLRPLRTLLDSAATLFPAVSWPLLQLLAALAQGQQGAAAAHQYLQVCMASHTHTHTHARARACPAACVSVYVVAVC